MAPPQLLQTQSSVMEHRPKQVLSPLQREHRRRLRMRMCAVNIERILQEYHEAEAYMMRVIRGEEE